MKMSQDTSQTVEVWMPVSEHIDLDDAALKAALERGILHTAERLIEDEHPGKQIVHMEIDRTEVRHNPTYYEHDKDDPMRPIFGGVIAYVKYAIED